MNDDNNNHEVSRNGVVVVYPAGSAPNLTAIYEETPIQEQANTCSSRILIVDDSSMNR